eukprot:scpid64542/ scgid21102/ Protein CASP
MAASASSLIQFWKDISLPRLQHELDTAAAEIAQRQDSADTSRKKLIELSRDYKRNTPEDERKRVSALLKSFQAEVDTLSRRAKAAEGSFLNLYKRLADAPDPAPALDQVSTLQKRLTSMQDLELENKKLRETLDQYNKEYAEVRNQEVTINRLREKVKEYEEEMEETAKARAQEKELEMQRRFTEKERDLTSQNVELATKLGIAEQQSASLHTALDSVRDEVVVLRTKNDELTEARSSELDMVSTDLERSQLRAQTAEKEAEQVRDQLANAQQLLKTGTATHSSSADQQDHHAGIQASLEAEIAAKDREVIRLVGDLQQLQSAMSKTKENSAAQITSLEGQLTDQSQAIHTLQEKITLQDDYDEIKRELSILKMIEFPSSSSRLGDSDDDEDNDDNDDVDGADSVRTKEVSKKPLEVLFLEKNKALVADNTSLKLAQTEMNVRIMELEQESVDLRESCRRQKDLITQLEMDLISVQSLLPSRTEGEGQAADSSTATTETLNQSSSPSWQPAQLPLSPATSKPPISAILPGSGGGSGSSSSAGVNASSNDSLLPIVSSQRERFRQRNLELEAETRQLHQTIAVLRNEVDTLRSDNIKLYEKIKFLQSYSSSAGKGGHGDVSLHMGAATTGAGAGGFHSTVGGSG